MKLPFPLPLGAPAGLWLRKEGACRDTASDAMLGGRLTTLGTQLCSEITRRTLTLPESDYPAGR
jgi:hypothetical protein